MTSPLEPNTTIAHYRIVSKVGAGGMGEVYRARFVSYRHGVFYANGKSLLLSAAESGKGPRCYQLDLPGGALRAVSPEGTDYCHPSPDGLSLVARRQSVGWFEFSTNGAELRPLPGINPDDEVISWSREGRSLFLCSGRNLSPRIERFELANGKRTVIQELTAGRTAGFQAPHQPSIVDGLRCTAWVYRNDCRNESFLKSGSCSRLTPEWKN